MALPSGSKTTIADVAKLAGVSVTTVSRVLNGEKYVRENKKKAVLSAIEKLEYQPNLYARSLGGDRSYLVGLLIDDPQGDYISGLQRGAMRECKKYGYHVVVEVFDQATTIEHIKSFLSKLSLTGVVLTPPVCDNEIVLAALTERQIPTVRISPSKPFPGMSDIKINDYQAACHMTEHLIFLGHKDIGFIVGDLDHADANERYRAFKDTMAASGYKINPNWIAHGSYIYESGLAAAKEIFSQDTLPTAIFASNDEMAAAAMTIANEYNVIIPSDMSVAGFDDIHLASVVSPTLTTIRQPVEEMAMAAVRRLAKLKEGESHSSQALVVDVAFVQRASTTTPKAIK